MKGSVKTNTDQHRMSKTKSKFAMTDPELSFTADACKAKIISQIEKQMRKGCIEGMLVSPCEKCDDYTALTNKIYVTSTRITVFGSSVLWKSHGYGETKARK